MSAETKSWIFRIAGLFGLAALLGLALWSQQIRTHSSAQATQATLRFKDIRHGTVEPTVGNDQDKTLLSPSGRVENGVRVADYDAFQYGFDPDPLVVRAGERVRLRVKSRDVMHGMMIHDIDFSTDIPPAKRKEIEFSAPEKPGEYPIYCSVFCGPGHGEMQGRLVVLPKK